jgi:hypothetical protein
MIADSQVLGDVAHNICNVLLCERVPGNRISLVRLRKET